MIIWIIIWKVIRKTKSYLKAFSPCQFNKAIKQSIMQLSLDTRWQTSFELLSLTGKCYSTGWKSLFEISAETDRVLPGALADCRCQPLCTPVYAVQAPFMKRPPWWRNSLKVRSQRKKKRPQTACLNLSQHEIPLLLLGGWFASPLLFQWCDTSFQMSQRNLYLHVSFMYREVWSTKSASRVCMCVHQRELTECVLSICCQWSPNRGGLELTGNKDGTGAF